MTIPLDDIKPEMWILIERDNTHDMPQHPTGVPFLVKAISLPFVVGYGLTTPEQIVSFRVTDYNICRVSRSYINYYQKAFKLCRSNQENQRAAKHPTWDGKVV